MIFPQPKKRSRLFSGMPQAALLVAVIILFYWPLAFHLRNLSIKAINFIVPERQNLVSSSEILALLTLIRDLKEENKILRAELGLANSQKIRQANLSFGGGYLFLDNYFLQGGKDNGFKDGDLVLAKGVLIGKITEVGISWSKFHIFSKLGEKVVLRSGENKEVLFGASGLGGGEFVAELPRDTILKVGDAVWWAEDPSYLIGFIENIVVRDTKFESEIRIISLLKIENLSIVEVISQ